MCYDENTAQILRHCGFIARNLGVATPIRVLLVDDSLDYALCFKALLDRVEGTRYQVETTQDTQAAREIICERRHDLYVIDLHMPSCSGIELVQTLQQEGYHFPFVILTGSQPEQDDRTALGHDCMMWLHKMEYVAPQELDRALRYALKNWLVRLPGVSESQEPWLPPTSVPCYAEPVAA